MDIRIPQLGEGVSAGTVVSILVKEGEDANIGSPLAVIA